MIGNAVSWRYVSDFTGQFVLRDGIFFADAIPGAIQYWTIPANPIRVGFMLTGFNGPGVAWFNDSAARPQTIASNIAIPAGVVLTVDCFGTAIKGNLGFAINTIFNDVAFMLEFTE